jgi:glycosyltransferase involved in cell wall biosynthesis
MKIVALLPVKNEAWALPSYLSSVTKIADEIIALDDSSTDDSHCILEAAGAKVFTFDSSNERVVNMSARRQKLLDLGRAAGGTHFIWLDADETFSAHFLPNAREIIDALTPGQKLTMRWVHVWKNFEHYLDDKTSPFGCIWKDFVVFDDGSDFPNRFLSEARTQGEWDNLMKLPQEKGVALHWQFANGNAMHLKHSWYKCQELIDGEFSPLRINLRYKVNYDLENRLKTKLLPTAWVGGITVPAGANSEEYHLQELNKIFTKYGTKFFERLDIWSNNDLKLRFIEENGYSPKPTIPPKWFVLVNDLKNKIRLSVKKILLRQNSTK